MSPHGSTSATGLSLVCGLCVVQGDLGVIQVWFGVVGGGLIWVQILDLPFYSSRKYTDPHTKPICEREAV